MKRIRYQVAMSLDGYIAGPGGEYDWIPMDPDIDFAAIMSQFDTLLVGRNTFQPMADAPEASMFSDMKTYVFSTSLSQEDHPDVTVVADNVEQTVAALREESGKDIWLFGGGQLFRSLLSADLVDTVDVAVVPVLLGGGIPVLPSPVDMAKLKLSKHTVYEKSGIVMLEYDVVRDKKRK